MERYAPNILDLAPRDMIARAIYTEIKEGRGIPAPDGTFYVGLDLTHLSDEVIDVKLPEITGFAKTYLGVDAKKPTLSEVTDAIATLALEGTKVQRVRHSGAQARYRVLNSKYLLDWAEYHDFEPEALIDKIRTGITSGENSYKVR